ncbi:SurA N-terminal domain-containing protein [Nocardioides okcheonensis]|uniref:SurA N-terminal domain-containing protein n=1 Tax=Nocardioides okcheonensis TaxID=2894081 RepID=UPI001E540106|nr:SurA N-terminal domain-containing protein [Nocardioides okcheonensis]UFN43451.1 SurA N-terminal domain-containing protein [Nocardioides okcheonensis]
MRTPSRTRSVLGSLAVVAVLTLSACGGGDGGSDASGASDDKASSSPSESGSTDASAAPEPDLDGIPDVVAEVNGEEVTKEEFVPIYTAAFQQAAATSQMSGQAPDEEALRKQTVDDLVDTELLTQEAESRGIEVSDQQVDDELTALAEQNQMGSADELLAAVEQQGVTEEQARSQIETQVMVEQLAADEDGSVDPTEKELRALYDRVKQQQAQSGQQGQEIPPFAQVHDQLEEQARNQQVGKVAGELVEQLRKGADITINL